MKQWHQDPGQRPERAGIKEEEKNEIIIFQSYRLEKVSRLWQREGEAKQSLVISELRR